MFSIADMQQEEYEEPEGEEAENEDVEAMVYPIRVSLSITKVGLVGLSRPQTLNNGPTENQPRGLDC